MNLLLLLSALLSALTGSASAMRTPTAAHAVTRAVVAAQVEGRSVQTTSRPEQPLPSLVGVKNAFLRSAMWLRSAAEPLYASRRRE